MKTAKERIFWIAVMVFLLCGIYTFLTINGLSYQQSQTYTPQANITMVPVDAVPTIDFALLTSPTPTFTPDPAMEGQSNIRTGLYVQITGTGESGLNIRTAPGINSEAHILAIESEVFQVIGGPVESDGYVWWQLAAPYNESRQGWAAENYLHIIAP